MSYSAHRSTCRECAVMTWHVFEILFHLPTFLFKYLKSRTLKWLFGLVAFSWITLGNPNTSGVTGLTIILSAFTFIPWSYLTAEKDYEDRMRANNLDRYKREHPEKISQSGRVRCFDCNGDRIFVRKIRDCTWMQEHVCTQCGKRLYYSKVG